MGMGCQHSLFWRVIHTQMSMEKCLWTLGHLISSTTDSSSLCPHCLTFLPRTVQRAAFELPSTELGHRRTQSGEKAVLRRAWAVRECQGAWGDEEGWRKKPPASALQSMDPTAPLAAKERQISVQQGQFTST